MQLSEQGEDEEGVIKWKQDIYIYIYGGRQTEIEWANRWIRGRLCSHNLFLYNSLVSETSKRPWNSSGTISPFFSPTPFLSLGLFRCMLYWPFSFGFPIYFFTLHFSVMRNFSPRAHSPLLYAHPILSNVLASRAADSVCDIAERRCVTNKAFSDVHGHPDLWGGRHRVNTRKKNRGGIVHECVSRDSRRERL